MRATGGQADEATRQAETCDLPPSVREQLEQPQCAGSHIIDMPHGIAFTEQGPARREGDGRADRLERRGLLHAQGGTEREMTKVAVSTVLPLHRPFCGRHADPARTTPAAGPT